MAIRLELVPILEQRQRQEHKSPYQSALELYTESEKIVIDVYVGKRKLPVTAAMVEGNELGEILDDEQHAGAIGGMFFVTCRTPEFYRKFAAMHALADHAAPRGFDETGLREHFQAIAIEVGYAKYTLIEREFESFLRWRKSIERTNFFQLNYQRIVDGVVERMGDVFASMSEYLKYKNKRLIEMVEE
ncbi:MAG: hypothetical protein ISS36_01705 [Candidatus Aenigmarchaeota archaeon]|nr:hypothetical protein [Candidatus Aenigmarchaeota archaeon]